MGKQRVFLGIFLFLFLLAGCQKIGKTEKSEAIEFVIVDEDEIPEMMKKTIEEEKEDFFQITYEDEEYLYIGQGYGKKEIEGYEITVDTCEESEHFIYFHTILTGPEEEPKQRNSSCPYLVARIERKGKQVLFLNH